MKSITDVFKVKEQNCCDTVTVGVWADKKSSMFVETGICRIISRYPIHTTFDIDDPKMEYKNPTQPYTVSDSNVKPYVIDIMVFKVIDSLYDVRVCIPKETITSTMHTDEINVDIVVTECHTLVTITVDKHSTKYNTVIDRFQPLIYGGYNMNFMDGPRIVNQAECGTSSIIFKDKTTSCTIVERTYHRTNDHISQEIFKIKGAYHLGIMINKKPIEELFVMAHSTAKIYSLYVIFDTIESNTLITVLIDKYEGRITSNWYTITTDDKHQIKLTVSDDKVKINTLKEKESSE